MDINEAQNQITNIMESTEGLSAWLNQRGFSKRDHPFKVHPEIAWSLFHSEAHPTAPRLMVIYQEKWNTPRKVLGAQIKRLQRECIRYVGDLRVSPHKASSPSLCLVACQNFVLVFDLTKRGSDLGRRLRWTRDLLSSTEKSAFKAFASFSAKELTTHASQENQPEEQLSARERLLRRASKGSGVLRYDFKGLFQGEALDEDFVQFMGFQRLRLLNAIISPDLKAKLLIPMLQRLDPDVSARKSLKELLSHKLKAGLIASVDTVLLRIVLYRYLEAQFGYQPHEKEVSGVAFGTTYDELIQKTTLVDEERSEEFINQIKEVARGEVARGSASKAEKSESTDKAQQSKRGQAKNKKSSSGEQLELFPLDVSPMVMTQEPDFKREIKERNDYYQRQAGGDLHSGRVSEASDLLYHYILEEFPESYAFFLTGTSEERYSFAYADLDPRAFQRFYENTIGTDLRISATSGELEVVHWHQNRKEQGAYFTDERVANYLVKKSIGTLFDEWKHDFQTWGSILFTPGLKLTPKVIKEAQTELRRRLDEVRGWRVIDPTMGGGIFLRAAFDSLSALYEPICTMLDGIPESVRASVLQEPSYMMFSSSDQREGEWQWYILLNMLYGVDVDIKAVNIASNLLTLSALTYKPESLCFPSFINTNLKRGNALVIPLTESRELFRDRHRPKLVQLMELRAQLRDPSMERDAWLKTLVQAESLTQEVSWAEAERTFAGAFGDVSAQEWRARVEGVGFFLYEAEFPEVFFEADGELKERDGFAVTLGNPPWEEPSATYTEFLPEFDSSYRELSKQESLQKGEELMSIPEIKSRWDNYAQSIEDYKSLLSTGFYRHQRIKIDGKYTGGHSNLYKYATELALRVLRPTGIYSVFIDSSLWSAFSASGLRRWIFDHHSLLEIYSFTNTKGIFEDVDGRYKFGAVSIRGSVNSSNNNLSVTFMREEIKELEAPQDHLFTIDLDVIKSKPTYELPEVRDVEQWRKYCKLIQLPSIVDGWTVDTRSGDFNAGNQRHYFLSEEVKKEGYYPLISGSQFNIFGVHLGALPTAWLDPSDDGIGGWLRDKQHKRVLKAIADYLESQGKSLKGGKGKAALRWAQAVCGDSTLERLPDEWVKLDWESYRIAWRDICRSTDKRTLIAGILPPWCGHDHTACTIQPHLIQVKPGEVYFEERPKELLLFYAGILSSFSCDSIARTKVTGTHLTATIFKGLNVSIYQDTPTTRRIADLTARLTCLPATKERPWADYTELAAAVGLTPEKDGLIDPDQRREAEIELNALCAQLYQYDRHDFEAMMRQLFIRGTHTEEHEEVMQGVLNLMNS